MRKMLIAIIFSVILNPIVVVADEPYNYAILWHHWGYESQDAYIEGYYAGVATTYMKAMEIWKPKSEKIEMVRKSVFLGDIKTAIHSVVSDLYKDPSNAYILLEDMLVIARNKINGKDITSDLQIARKHAIETKELNEKIK